MKDAKKLFTEQEQMVLNILQYPYNNIEIGNLWQIPSLFVTLAEPVKLC